MLPKDVNSLENVKLLRTIPAQSQNASLVLPAVSEHTYILYTINITSDNNFTYTITQGITQIKAGEGGAAAPVEEIYPSGLTTDIDNVAITITVSSAGNYSINVGYKLI